jgi:hypothetical protein
MNNYSFLNCFTETADSHRHSTASSSGRMVQPDVRTTTAAAELRIRKSALSALPIPTSHGLPKLLSNHNNNNNDYNDNGNNNYNDDDNDSGSKKATKEEETDAADLRKFGAGFAH